MPYINVKTNQKIDSATAETIKSQLGQAISIVPGKSESWLMVELEDERKLYFKGDGSAPLAIVTVEIYGSASSAAYSKLTGEISSILNSGLGISPSNCYVKYYETSNWGWNGSNL